MFNLGNSKNSLLSKKEEQNKYYVDDYECDLMNHNDSHAIIINNIHGTGNNILDVGCGVGYIGRKLKELYECNVDGIEIDKEAYKVAKTYYNHVYNFSIEEINNVEYKKFLNGKKQYDYIIFADLLEHLCDPGLIIANLYNKLKDDGKMIVSIPNVSHIDIISNLIDGRFNYNKTGILDSTHLRFFTEKSFYEFIDNVAEKYNLKISVKTLSKTYAKGNDENDNFLFDVIGMECYVFQNIFEISKSEVSLKNSKKIKKNYNYKKVNDIYKIHKKSIMEYCNRINECENELEKQKAENDVLKNEINKIMNSNSWKMTKPFRKIKLKLKK